MLPIPNAFERLTGLKREDVVGKRVTDAIPSIKDCEPNLFEIYGEVALTGKSTQFEVFFVPLEMWLSITVYCPMKGYFVAVFDNITDRKRAEEALREAEERLRIATDHRGHKSPLSAFTHGNGTKIVPEHREPL